MIGWAENNDGGKVLITNLVVKKKTGTVGQLTLQLDLVDGQDDIPQLALFPAAGAIRDLIESEKISSSRQTIRFSESSIHFVMCDTEGTKIWESDAKIAHVKMPITKDAAAQTARIVGSVNASKILPVIQEFALGNEVVVSFVKNNTAKLAVAEDPMPEVGDLAIGLDADGVTRTGIVKAVSNKGRVRINDFGAGHSFKELISFSEVASSDEPVAVLTERYKVELTGLGVQPTWADIVAAATVDENTPSATAGTMFISKSAIELAIQNARSPKLAVAEG